MSNKIIDNVILIPARKGSQRIKDKNIKKLKGKPLISYIIATAVESNCGPVFVSTDSIEYKNIAEFYGAQVPFIRPTYLATSTTPSIWVIIHFIKWYKTTFDKLPNFLTFCPPTNPMLKSNTISSMLNKIRNNKSFNSIVTYTKPKTHPFRIVGIDKSGKINNSVVSIGGKTINEFERSQDFPLCYEGSPACRITRSKFFIELLSNNIDIKKIKYNKTYDYLNSTGFEISPFESSDIDSIDDFRKLENKF